MQKVHLPNPIDLPCIGSEYCDCFECREYREARERWEREAKRQAERFYSWEYPA